MFQQIEQLLKTNGFASGCLFLLACSVGLGLLYTLQSYLIRFFKYWFFTQINFSSDDTSFLAIQNWLFNQNYTHKRCANLMVKNIYKGEGGRNQELFEDQDPQSKICQIFVPSYGTHYFMLGWRPTILDYTKSDSKEIRRQEYINIQIFNPFNKLNFAKNLVKESSDIFNKTTYQETSIYGCLNRYSGWTILHKKNIKQHPILSYHKEYDEIITHISKFLENEEWYSRRGINYKQGFLFAGVPGSGKTSCVLSLAQYFQKHIYILNLSDVNIDDAKFIELVTSLPKNSVLLIEDIDAISGDRKLDTKKLDKDDYKIVSLSTILNSLDGLLTPEGLLFFITTNYPEKLDDALIRPGRVNLIKRFNNANSYQIGALFDRFLPDAPTEERSQFISTNINISMAEIESKLISKVI